MPEKLKLPRENTGYLSNQNKELELELISDKPIHMRDKFGLLWKMLGSCW